MSFSLFAVAVRRRRGGSANGESSMAAARALRAPRTPVRIPLGSAVRLRYSLQFSPPRCTFVAFSLIFTCTPLCTIASVCNNFFFSVLCLNSFSRKSLRSRRAVFSYTVFHSYFQIYLRRASCFFFSVVEI